MRIQIKYGKENKAVKTMTEKPKAINVVAKALANMCKNRLQKGEKCIFQEARYCPLNEYVQCQEGKIVCHFMNQPAWKTFLKMAVNE